MKTERVPDFLIIGAMKAGTTTLHRDLSQHPQIFLSDPKEPNDLASDKVLSPAGLRSYQGLFSNAGSDQLCGEASTAYTRAPRFSGSADRALAVCGPNLKLIYIVRDPYARAVSHYRYAYVRGRTRQPMDVALIEDSEYTEVSDYAAQVAPWARAFGSSAILIVSFDSYIRAREVTVEKVLEFLGLSPQCAINTEGRFNVTDEIRVSKGLMESVVASKFFQRSVKPLLSSKARMLGKRILLRPGTPAPQPNADPELRDRFSKLISEQAHLMSQVDGVARLADLAPEIDLIP